jgi:hypothetical protein
MNCAPTARVGSGGEMTRMPWTWLGMTIVASRLRLGKRPGRLCQMAWTTSPTGVRCEPSWSMEPSQQRRSSVQIVTK